MRNKSIWLLVSCVIVAVFMMVSCAPVVTEVEEAAPPAVEEEVVTAPPEEEEVAPPKEEEVVTEEEVAPSSTPTLPTPTSAPAPTVEELAIEIHQDAASIVLAKAKVDNYYKYGIYAARVLTVKHPEMYLKADGLFLKTIQTNVGFKKSYEIEDVHSGYLNGKEMAGPSFSFDYVDFTKYKIIESAELYPDHYPVLPYLDRRLLPVASTLKSVRDRITQLEKAEQYYFALKETGTSVDRMYLVYCDNENSYLYHQGELIYSKDLQKVDEIDGNPILIFNEKRVWYPLMGRDDTSKNTTLNEIVDNYATGVVVPKLSDFEAQVVERFAEVTQLEGLAQDAAIAAAARSWDCEKLENRPFRPIWETFADIQWPARGSIVRELIKDANYLSPIVAYLCAISEEHDGEAKIDAICEEYLKYAATPGADMAHGHLWMCGIMEYTVEDSYYTHGGHCVVQAANIQACLDLLDIDNYRMQAKIFEPQYSAHDHVYIPEYDVMVDNGRFNKMPPVYHKSVLCHIGRRSPVPLNGVTFLQHSSKWASLLPMERYCGTLSPLEAIDILKYLRSVYNDDLRGVTLGPKTTSFEALIKELEAQQERWKPLELP